MLNELRPKAEENRRFEMVFQSWSGRELDSGGGRGIGISSATSYRW
ncbi:hypothetical protein J2Z66_001228 [Paenibacillus eucommiae]|uniref:Uncharacterized protein n=1 Tax=Paenibacillus eucommiae TaxID=1355755 RepID=A0ABS4IQ27_9BACL|nr:hypothetical protein [Paenibacillus eucommiae]